MVSVITCCRNEIANISAFLRSLEAQTVEIEAVLADGRSVDGTRQAVDEFARTRAWVQVIDNPRRIASSGLNAAIRASSGSIIIRMDAHTEYAPDYAGKCVEILEGEQAQMVGGPMRMAHGGGYWQNAIGLAYPSRFFSGGSRVYDVDYEGPVDSVLYGCWPRAVLEAAGLFDERMARNQDDELALRIAQGGGKIWQSSRIRCWYHPRRSLAALAKQFFGYGLWKVYTMRKHRTVVRVRHIVPALVLIFLMAGLGLAFVNDTARRVLLTGVAAYCAVILGVSTLLVRRATDIVLLPALLLVFPTVHLAYGCGTISGLLRFKNS